MSLASETRRAVDGNPFLVTALRAGVVNYTAAARYLDVDGETDAVATAIRRYAEELPPYETDARDVRVRMERGITPAPIDGAKHETALLAVGGTSFRSDGGELTAIAATGDVDATALGAALGRLESDGIEPIAAGVGEGTMMLVVDDRDGVDALRTVEAALEAVPEA
ncbi:MULTISPECIES: DUF7523 family protein [Natronococcus]|uniref:Uncharacterized protein n=1 Tax=Natronococcus jeotgali DSM 18795 TaxID=1227498 RepID=L9WZQ9_9EURY|nr:MULTISPECIES: hypothetical protein [Natronococcus]ELY53853.1 hypothetical protein C492_16953 [Natronococcus jeotgali DSM 18795]NKE36779.1 hypothetical protein [Natronococcus sp. JC468]